MTTNLNLASPGHNEKQAPSAETYGALQKAFDTFNAELFGGRLPDCIFVMQRAKATKCGHFHANIWREAEREDEALQIDEIAINPNAMISMGLTEILQTLAHEMCHLEQHHHGEPSRNGYHNKEWGAMMDAIGLTPSNTGAEGGKRTGQQMADFITPGGAFEATCGALLESGFQIPWVSIDTTPAPKEAKASNRAKFTCGGCGANAWGKPELSITCTQCDERMLTKEQASLAAQAQGAARVAAAQIDLEAYIARKA